jgi:AraC-like DNA-binding protein
MPERGTYTFTDPDEFEAGVRGARFDLVLTRPGDFKAYLTCVELRTLHLLRGREELPRIAHVSLAPEPAFVTFPIQADPPPIWSGIELRLGDIVFHSPGESMHQRTSGPSQWGFISLAPQDLAAWGRALTGLDLVPPVAGRVLRPPSIAAANLLHLHAEAGRLTETRPDVIAHPAVAHALEQDLIHALTACLVDGKTRQDNAARRRHASIMVRLEDMLAAHPDQPLHLAEICAAIEVTERTLRLCCAQFVGMGPNRYLRLRRMKMARTALRHADPATAHVAEIARRYGFSELGRFAVMYRTLFGETPSTTLRHAAERS